jgi:hypothetical protein
VDVRSRTDADRTAPLRTRHGKHGRPARRNLYLLALAAVTACALAATALAALTGHLPGGSGEVTVDRPAAPASRVGAGAPRDWPSWGFTHTQYSVDAAHPQRALTDLANGPIVQVTAIMGWGVDNPAPRPGRFDWSTLDRRMRTIEQTKGTPVVTLCCAPDWMKGGRAGRTDWNEIETAVERDHFDDFAELSAAVARRYPQVKHFMVWNEFKGFWNPSANRWDYEGYTDLYNEVYDALKNVNPDIKVGGPYMVMNSNAPGWRHGPRSELSGSWGSMDQRNLDAMKYWAEHKKGADFVVVDGHSQPVQREIRLNDFQALTKFSDVTRWVRALVPDLPVWWAEWYVEPDSSGWTDQQRGAVLTAAMMEFIRGGAAGAFYWNPQTTTAAHCPGCLWAGPQAGGAGTPTLSMLQNFARWFPPETPLVDVNVSDPAVRVLAQDRRMVVVNGSNRAVRPTIDGKPLDLAPYEVKWVDR